MTPALSTFWQIMFSFSALHGFFIAIILLFNKKGNVKANRILAVLVISISIILTNYFLSSTGIYKTFPHLMYFAFPLWYVIGPIFYYYFSSLIAKQKKFKWTDILHFVPFLVCILVLSPFYTSSAEAKLAILNGTGARTVPAWQFQAIIYLYFVQTVGYIIYTSIMLRNYEKNFKEQSADTKVVDIDWLRTLIIILIVFLTIDFVVANTMSILKINNPNYTNSSIIVITSFIYFIAYNLILHPSRVFSSESIKTAEVNKNEKYKTSVLGDEEIKQIAERLTEIMEKEKPFLNEELRLSDLADILEITPHKLSQVINQSFNQNFYNFVNMHRVKEVQKRLTDPGNNKKSILGIALDTGFNSNASFYRIFKQYTGLTPSQYLKSNSLSNLSAN